MNDLGLLLVGGATRATALAAVGAALALCLRRRGPAAGALAVLSTLSVLVAVSVLSLTPWPRFWTLDLGRRAAAAAPAAVAPGPVPAAAPAPAPVPLPAPLHSYAPTVGSWLLDFARAFSAELRRSSPAPAAPVPGWRWPAWVAAGLLGLSALALARLALALRAVGVLRERSSDITDAGLCEEVDVVRAEIGCVRPVAVRESRDLATPATVGWLRPVLLLPAGWRTWDSAERRAVLAHELAHVVRADYLAGLWAKFCLSLHAYHPLAHWLVARLRLEQELAADAWGARLSGGNRPYLEALARLALRRAGPLESSPSPAAWPARPFLPTRGTLLKRIDMLQNSEPNPLRTAPLPPLVRALTVAAIAAAGLLVAGLRGPAANAQAPPPAREVTLTAAGFAGEYALRTTDEKPAPADLDALHAPAGTSLVVTARPAAVIGRPGFKPFADTLDAAIKGAENLNLRPSDIDRVTVFGFHGPAGVRVAPVAVFRTVEPQIWKDVTWTFLGEMAGAEFNGRKYLRSTNANIGAVVYTPDDRTLVIGPEPAVKLLIGQKKGEAAARHPWDDALARVRKGQLTIAFDPALAPSLGVPLAGPFAAFMPLIDNATGYAVSVDLDEHEDLSLDLVATCPTPEGARKVSETIAAALTLAKNSLPEMEKGPAQGPEGEEVMLRALKLVGPLLNNAKRHPVDDERVVEYRSRTDGDVAALLATLVPSVKAARAAARQSQSKNNMKQLGLAMHIYLDQTGHFPPAAGRSPDGRLPYSWRVALLPYIEQQSLYKEYDFNEPWDGPKNRKLIAKMPTIYGYPGDDRPGRAAYFVLTGPDTVFPPGNQGVSIREIIDGTSSTLLIAEAKRDIPWTKPEDIPYDAAKPLPQLGGFTPDGFHILFADGAARFLSGRVIEPVLRGIITRAKGEVVDPSLLRAEPRERALTPQEMLRGAAGIPPATRPEKR